MYNIFYWFIEYTNKQSRPRYVQSRCYADLCAARMDLRFCNFWNVKRLRELRLPTLETQLKHDQFSLIGNRYWSFHSRYFA